MRERKAIETREPPDQAKQQTDQEDRHRGRSSLVAQQPAAAAGPPCARPQLTAPVNLLTYDDHEVSRSSVVTITEQLRIL